MNDLSARKLGNLIGIAAVMFVLSFGVGWSGGASAQTAARAAAGVACGWAIGNLQRTGSPKMTLDGLKKDA
jgi:hypothetical protein